jgi:arsenite-transporting ATPase
VKAKEAGPLAVPTLLVSGRGGSGRTTVAAATALHAAESGRRVLLIGAADPHRTLDEVLGVRLGPVPGAVAGGLHALRLDSRAAFEDETARLLTQAKPAFDLLGVDPLEPEELTALPGAGHLALLRTLREHAASGEWEFVVVDAPVVTELIAALALPEELERYLARLLPRERQAARALRPVLAALAGVPMPADWLFEARERATEELARAGEAAVGEHVAVRLVTEPGPLATRELRRARAALALFGHRVDAVIANRVLPTSEDPFLTALRAGQLESLEVLRTEWDVPVHAVPHLGRDPGGREALAELASECPQALAESTPAPAEEGAAAWTVEDRLGTDGVLVWRLPLPGADRADLDLIRRVDELIVSYGEYRRTLTLPSALRRCNVVGAALKEGTLAVRFKPDPALWPQRQGTSS